MENLLKSNFKAIIFVFTILTKKPTFARFLKKIYKIRAISVFPSLITLILQYPSFDLIWKQFPSKKYQFDKNNLYFKNIFQLMFFFPKMKSIFSIFLALNKIQYKFKNRAVSKLLEKLVIVVTNLLICQLIVKMNYKKLLLIIKLIFVGIEFEIFREANCTYNGLAKPEKKTRSS